MAQTTVTATKNLLQNIPVTQEGLVNFLQTWSPSLGEIVWFVIFLIVGIVTFLVVKEWVERLALYVSIRFFDKFTNVGTCIEYKGFFGTIRKITTGYVLLEKAQENGRKVRIFKRIPIKEFQANSKDFYETKCFEVCKDYIKECEEKEK